MAQADPAPAVSDEARRPTPEMIAAAWRAFRGNRPGMMLGPGPGFAEALTAAMALDPRVAELKAEVTELRKRVSSAVFHFFCCGPGAHTDEDECGQFVPAMADLARAISFDADPATNAEIATVAVSQAVQRRLDAAWRGRATERR